MVWLAPEAPTARMVPDSSTPVTLDAAANTWPHQPHPTPQLEFATPADASFGAAHGGINGVTGTRPPHRNEPIGQQVNDGVQHLFHPQLRSILL